MSNRRSALGRGLGALISNPGQAGAQSEARRATPDRVETASGPRPAEPAGPQEIPVELIDPNPEQPRRVFDPEQLQQLASSILRHGVLQPIVVRRSGERYELIVGERRWRASRAAGLPTIPAVVADVASGDRLELAIVENVQRHDLNPIELAHAYKALAEAGSTQEEIGRKVSMDRSSVANHLRLLDLSRDLQEDVETGRLSMGHAKALLQVQDPARRSTLRDEVLAEGLSVRATELAGRRIAGPAPARKRKRVAPPGSVVDTDPDRASLVELLRHRFQTRVQLSGTPKRGKVEIEYFSGEDLDRIAGLLLGDR